MTYSVWHADPEGGFCTLEDLEKVNDAYELKRGVSRAKDFPEDARFRMDSSHPKEVKLPDNVMNTDRLLVVSPKLKQFVEEKNPTATEYLPVTIYNHKKRVATKDYFIINPHKVVDCIDQAKSELVWNKIDTQLVSRCKKLVLDEKQIDPNLLLFRPKYLPLIVLTRSDLAEAIIGEGFKGAYFFKVNEFQT